MKRKKFNNNFEEENKEYHNDDEQNSEKVDTNLSIKYEKLSNIWFSEDNTQLEPNLLNLNPKQIDPISKEESKSSESSKPMFSFNNSIPSILEEAKYPNLDLNSAQNWPIQNDDKSKSDSKSKSESSKKSSSQTDSSKTQKADESSSSEHNSSQVLNSTEND